MVTLQDLNVNVTVNQTIKNFIRKNEKHREAVIKKITMIQEQLDGEEREARISFLVFDCAACA